MEAAPMDGKVVSRELVGEIMSGDGRTLDLRIVPYNTPTVVRDNGGPPYQEEWLPGVFDAQMKAANRVDVLVNFEHEQGIRGTVGRGVELRDMPDGAEGTFRMLSGSDADKALELVNEGVARGVSLEAIPIKSNVKDGVVQRVKARLVNVALCRSPAFTSAQVLAVREEPDPEPEPEPDAPEPVLVERRTDIDEALSRVGFESLLKRAIVRGPWDGSSSRFDDEQWQRSCILDRGSQFDTAKTRYAFPVLEPNGDLNVNGMHAAAARLNQAQASPAARAAAARRLLRYYRQAGEDPPPSLMAMAGRS